MISGNSASDVKNLIEQPSWAGRRILHFVILGLFGIWSVTCGQIGTKIRVKPLADVQYAPKSQNTVVEELANEPQRPYTKIAKLIATTQTDDEQTVREKMVEKARTLGADAVFITKVDVLKHMGHPRFQSTLDPEVQYSIFTGGPGSGIPLFFDPWTYQQTQQDGTTWTLFLSGVAIRYADSRTQESRRVGKILHEL